MAGRDIEENPEGDWHMKTRGWGTALSGEKRTALHALSLSLYPDVCYFARSFCNSGRTGRE